MNCASLILLFFKIFVIPILYNPYRDILQDKTITFHSSYPISQKPVHLLHGQFEGSQSSERLRNHFESWPVICGLNVKIRSGGRWRSLSAREPAAGQSRFARHSGEPLICKARNRMNCECSEQREMNNLFEIKLQQITAKTMRANSVCLMGAGLIEGQVFIERNKYFYIWRQEKNGPDQNGLSRVLSSMSQISPQLQVPLRSSW